MRQYDDPVEVRRGPVAGWPDERGPAQFLWRGRLWKVRAVVAHWVETGPWWQRAEVRAVLGAEESTPAPAARPVGRGGGVAELLVEHEVWRVEAGPGEGGGVFDLVHDQAGDAWQLVGCVD